MTELERGKEAMRTFRDAARPIVTTRPLREIIDNIQRLVEEVALDPSTSDRARPALTAARDDILALQTSGYNYRLEFLQDLFYPQEDDE